ncbi:MAG TPA: hypothetical protein VIK74_08980, partial [Parasegetibacter sp.]
AKPTDDTSTIGISIFNQFAAESLLLNEFGEKSRPKIYPVGKISAAKKDETYLLVKATHGRKSVLYLLCYDQHLNYLTGMPALVDDRDEHTYLRLTIDKKYNITRVMEKRGGDGQVIYTRNVFILNADGELVLILTESNDTSKARENILNPIDTLPQVHKWSGDYTQGKKNLISVRDGRNEEEVLIFIHFEKENGTCRGELKGRARFISPDIARYYEDNDPCVIEFEFKGNTVKMKEVKSCGRYRDVRCFFEGSFNRVSKKSK